MMKSLRLLSVVLSALLLVAVPLLSPSSAAQAASAVMVLLQAQGATVSESAAVAAAQRVVKGRVLSVQLIESRGPPVYRVKILTENGRVRTVHVDGQSGDVISY